MSTPPQHHIAHPVLDGDAMSAWLGVRLAEASYGRAVCEMTLREDQVNGFGIGHGGVVFAFADTAFAMACNDLDADGSTVTVAAGADITFLRPARVGDLLRARAQEVHRGRSGLYDIRVVRVLPDGSDGEVIAEFRGRSRAIPGAAVPHPRQD